MNLNRTLCTALVAVGFMAVMATAGQGVAAPRTAQLREELHALSPTTHWNAKWIAAPLPPHNSLRKLSWVWGNTGGGDTAVTRAWFRRDITLPAKAVIHKAVFDLTADEQFTLYVNGTRAAQNTQWRGANWNTIYHSNITRLLHGGVNTVAIAASNAGDNINHAGLIGSLTIVLGSGAKIQVPINKKWLATEEQPSSGWNRPGFQAVAWKPAHIITRFGGGPWGHRPNPRQALPLFRHGFAISKPIAHATVYVSGLGQYDLFINGQRVGDDVMQPGWTDYKKTVLYNRYNVTSLLHGGQNAIGVMLGTGMYDCPEGTHRYEHAPNPYGRPKLILQLHITFTDGTQDNIVSNRRWRTVPGPVRFSSIYGGEDYNAMDAIPGWNKPEFNDSRWPRAMVVKGSSVRN